MRVLIEAFGTAEDVWKASDKEIVESHLLKGKTEASFWRTGKKRSLKK